MGKIVTATKRWIWMDGGQDPQHCHCNQRCHLVGSFWEKVTDHNHDDDSFVIITKLCCCKGVSYDYFVSMVGVRRATTSTFLAFFVFFWFGEEATHSTKRFSNVGASCVMTTLYPSIV